MTSVTSDNYALSTTLVSKWCHYYDFWESLRFQLDCF